ncbi:hypothetical protein [Chryseobacterium sp. 2987]|nr:hypothetical protein [Chryseobacterium sp. 2987]MDR6922666.1 hypothetical protein [Chryseobacterium sp. 2987]
MGAENAQAVNIAAPAKPVIIVNIVLKMVAAAEFVAAVTGKIIIHQ